MPRLGNKKYAYTEEGQKEYKKDLFKMGLKNLKKDSLVNKQRANMAIQDSVNQKFANQKYLKAINILNQKMDTMQKNHNLQITQLQKQQLIDSARNKNLPNRKQSGPASTPKRGGGEVK